MKTTTVIANDSSSAMEDIISKLGEDAVILSTEKKNGKVDPQKSTIPRSKNAPSCSYWP